MKLQPSQIELLGKCCGADWFTAENNTVYRRCLRLHARKLVARHGTDKNKFIININGLNALAENDDGKGL
jgi:hypothetical protein